MCDHLRKPYVHYFHSTNNRKCDNAKNSTDICSACVSCLFPTGPSNLIFSAHWSLWTCHTRQWLYRRTLRWAHIIATFITWGALMNWHMIIYAHMLHCLMHWVWTHMHRLVGSIWKCVATIRWLKITSHNMQHKFAFSNIKSAYQICLEYTERNTAIFYFNPWFDSLCTSTWSYSLVSCCCHILNLQMNDLIWSETCMKSWRKKLSTDGGNHTEKCCHAIKATKVHRAYNACSATEMLTSVCFRGVRRTENKGSARCIITSEY